MAHPSNAEVIATAMSEIAKHAIEEEQQTRDARIIKVNQQRTTKGIIKAIKSQGFTSEEIAESLIRITENNG